MTGVHRTDLANSATSHSRPGCPSVVAPVARVSIQAVVQKGEKVCKRAFVSLSRLRIGELGVRRRATILDRVQGLTFTRTAHPSAR